MAGSTPAHTILDCIANLKYRARGFGKGDLSNLFEAESEFEETFFQAHFRPMILAGLALQAEFTKEGQTNPERYNRLRALYNALSGIKIYCFDSPVVQRVGAKFNEIPVSLRLKTYADMLREGGHENAATSLLQLERSLADHLD